ncbi:M20/M25/M40 family metallo-hydrolase [Fusobacterium gastrosuis]|uniref:M20/M25/M40 family metallo-hydrolase n=1 Tax=Fusobacterium gastrosuis TaxID=1755100 RepID=UPI002A9744CF|nr:M20/M25/M40 family metallo-hydrolase [Fusobacterium gastrosuis]
MNFVNERISKRIEEIALELTEVFSVSDTYGEVEVSEKVYEILKKIPYFTGNPNDLFFVNTNDKLGRKSVVAILRGKKQSKNAVVLIGHTDTVGISDYGALAEYANRPYELAERLKNVKLDEASKRDLESGEYLFGRGIFDMKSGDAVIMALLEEISKDLDNLEGNIIFAAVCDEEANSSGMLSVVPKLVELQEKEKFEYLALLDTDYITAEFIGDESKNIYIGTVGKLMPSFFVVGKETHVGESFNGIDPNEISSAIMSRINMNTEFCDIADGEVSLPPISLYQRDQKTEYSVQVGKTSVLYFNYATHTSTPDMVLEKMKKAAFEAFEGVVVKLNEQYKKFCEMSSNRNYKKLPWEARVLTYTELLEKVREEKPQIDEILKKYSEELLKNENIDTRVFAQRMVEKLQATWKDQNPVVVVYFSPPYYPHIYIDGTNPKDKALIDAVDNAVKTTKTDYKLAYKKFFPYISDLSYGAAPKDPAIIAALKNNMPGFGVKYSLPLEDMQKLSLPVLDIGCFGYDAHKFTERVEKKYSFTVTPELVYKTIMNLLKR